MVCAHGWSSSCQAEDALLRHIAQHVAPPAVPASALFRTLTTTTAVFATSVAPCALPLRPHMRLSVSVMRLHEGVSALAHAEPRFNLGPPGVPGWMHCSTEASGRDSSRSSLGRRRPARRRSLSRQP